MFKHSIFCALIHCSFACFSHQLLPEHFKILEQQLNNKPVGFAAIEHRFLGDKIALKFTQEQKTVRGEKLTLTNGLQLSYGEIIMLAGDLIGDPHYPISSCKLEQQSDCFDKQFRRLGQASIAKSPRCDALINQVNGFKQFYKQLANSREQARRSGVSDWQFYLDNGSIINKKLNKISCGGSFISDYLPFGNYLYLSEVNYDHFVPDALIAYRVGHAQALQQAKRAYHAWHDEQNTLSAQSLLHSAYAMNAYASHYLTDALSAGHMRTPRRALAKQLMLPKIITLLIANLMHDEENQFGLRVVNHLGDAWTAFGDGNLFIEQASKQRAMIQKTLQVSVDSLYKTYASGIIPQTYPELTLLPDYSKIDALNETAPLFKLIDGKVYRRRQIRNRYAHHWTKHWSGLLTLLQFNLN